VPVPVPGARVSAPFDTPPDPLPTESGSVSPAWRRRALLVAVALLVLVAFASLTQAPSSRPQTATGSAIPPSPAVRRTLRGRRISRRPTVRAQRHPSGRTPHDSVVAAASAAYAVPSTSASSSPPSVPAPGPFIYLGK
jgi:hypothetical protein